MEYQVRFEEAGKIAGERVVLYGIVEAAGPEAAVVAAKAQLVAKLQRAPELMGFKAAAVWGEKEGVIIL